MRIRERKRRALMDESRELIQEFLIESLENLGRLDQEFVEVEKRPADRDLLSSIFRTIHTIKGTCGFLGFTTLEATTHRAENILSELREGRRRLSPELTTLLLETVDAIKTILGNIEATGGEGDDSHEDLRSRLQAAAEQREEESPAASAPQAQPAAGGAEPAKAKAARKKAASGAKPPKLVSPRADVPVPVPPQPVTVPPQPVAPRAAAESGNESAAEPATESVAAHRASLTESTIRVDIGVLDSLMNLVGELVLARNQIIQYTTTQHDAAFTATSQRLNLITTELQGHIMKTRMQPIGVVWNKLPRVVRDLGQSFGKLIELKMEGAGTELDKTIIEAIKDPLTHIVRNSCDHGIETPGEREAAGKPAKGALALRAYHEGGQVNIEITDDGRGINPQRLKEKAVQSGLLPAERAERLSDHEAVNLIFLAGLSTAKEVTKVSGRGVGMDVVRTNIEKIGGSIDLQSRPGHGTAIKIRIPLTLAIIPALVVVCDEQRFAIPQVSLVELVRLEEGAAEQRIEWIQGAPVYRLRGKLLPLVYLDRILQLERKEAKRQDVANIIVLQAEESTFGLVVDAVNDTAEIVVKPLSKLLKGSDCYAGATIMGDGAVALILDVAGVAQLGGVIGEPKEQVIGAHERSSESAGERQALLLFRSGGAKRLAVPLAAVNRLEEFPVKDVERSAGRPVVQYRNQILPLIPLADYLEGGGGEQSERLQVVVFQHQDKRVGIVVDEILDIVQEPVTIRSRTSRAGILGSAVVSGQVTDFVDLRYVIESVDPHWFRSSKSASAAETRVMIAENSPMARGLLRSYFEMAGFEVVEAGDADEALRRLNRQRVDVLIFSLDPPDEAAFDLLRRVREAPELRALPVICLSDEPGRLEGRAPSGYEFDACVSKFDQQEMLASVSRLAGALRGQLETISG